MARVKFQKGGQRKFIFEVLKKLNCPSLRALNQYGLDIPYSTLKNYYSEARTLPEELFNTLLFLSKIEVAPKDSKKVSENWGQSIGGSKKHSRKKG